MIAVISWSLDYVIGASIRENKNVKVSYITSDYLQFDALFLGPCETSWGAMPTIIDSITGLHSYNLALSHSDYADNYLHLYLYLKYNPAPDYLFIYATPEAFDTVANAFHSYRFAPFVKDSVVNSTIRDCDPTYAKFARIPLVRYGYYNRQLLYEALQGSYHWIMGRQEPFYASGYIPANQLLWANHTTDFFAVLDDSIHYNIEPTREKYFRKVLELAIDYGIKPIVYEAPLLKEYQRIQANRQEMLSKIEEIAYEFGVQFWTFDTLAICSKKEYFFTPLSMNPEGTKQFNNILGNVIKQKLEHD